MGVKLPDFMPDMPMLHSFRTYLLSRPIVDCHEVLSVILQKRQFLAAILLSNDVEGFRSSREMFCRLRTCFSRVLTEVLCYTYMASSHDVR